MTTALMLRLKSDVGATCGNGYAALNDDDRVHDDNNIGDGDGAGDDDDDDDDDDGE